MRVQGRCRAAAARAQLSHMRYVPLVSFAILVSCAEAFIDIRAPEKDAAVLEAQPQTQVHLVFSSHLVSLQIKYFIKRVLYHLWVPL